MVVSQEEPTDRRVWSGTTSNIYDALKNQGIEVSGMKLSSLYSKVYKKVVMIILNKILKRNVANFETTEIGAKFWSKQLDRKISQKKADYYIIPAGASIIAYSKNNKKLVDIPDATYALMNNYYYSGVKNSAEEIGNKIDRLALNRSNRIIVPSTWAYNSVIEDYNQKESKVLNIPFGANMPYKEVNPKTLTEEKNQYIVSWC